MGKKLFLKPCVNKKNNQININLNRKDLPKDLLDKILNIKKLEVELLDWE